MSRVATAFPAVLDGYAGVEARTRRKGDKKGMNKHTIGVDISKAHLQVHRLPEGSQARFPNTPRGFAALIEWLDDSAELVVYEPTGAYHRDFEQALLEAGLALAKVNPRRFAQAAGQKAKTDPVDARVLAEMGRVLPLRPTSAASPAQRELKELSVAHDALIKDRVAAPDRRSRLRSPLLKRQNAARRRSVERQLDAVDARIQALVKRDPALARRFAILTSIPGFGQVTAAGLPAELPELGDLDAKAVASLAGLAPLARDSGQWRGRRFIRGLLKRGIAAADLLRGFLPDSPEAGFDFGTLEPLPASHVGRGLKRREGDLMWSLRARAAPGDGWVHVLVLLEFRSRVDTHMALRAMTYTGLALEGLVRRGQVSREDARSTVQRRSPLPPVVPFVVYNGKRRWTAPVDVSELFAPAPPVLERLRPSNRYVLLDMGKADVGGVPWDNAVGLHIALEKATLDEAQPVLPRLSAALAGPEHLGLRVAFAEWLRRSWAEEYGVLADLDDKSRRELDRMVAEGEVEAMGSLAVERWREQKAQIHARGRTQGRTEGIEHYRHSLARQASRRFGAGPGERLSALLAGVSEPDQLAAVGDAIIDCKTGAELLAAARRIAGVN
ncbi:MAG: transposase [Gammaproteobacteria bacterium]|nr:transposase [Gammaproteobacteria bacterium]